MDDPQRRFEKLYIPEPNTGCFLWLGELSSTGYGRFWFNGKHVQANRYCKELQLGRAIPSNLEACHSCDVRHCVNPQHIFEGSSSENKIDAVKKGRLKTPMLLGEANGRAKLKAVDIPIIRSLAENGMSYIALGKQFNVADFTIGKICRGRAWTIVPIV